MKKHALVAYREKNKLSQKAFAVLAQSTAGTICRVELGQISPRIVLIKRIVKATKNQVTAADLVGAA